MGEQCEPMGESGDEEEEVEEAKERMKVEERVLGEYECPEFVFSKLEEKRLYRPWRRGVIVKLLGRRIGFKAQETRLKQMWVRKGVISIIDLSNDYYLVAFSNEEDQYSALMDGPWFIYDHYLTVKEWSPNFHPASDTIKEVAVWMRISGLPIEYYDREALHFIGNRVGKTVKVDKNTLTQERGKYARLCVQVNLTRPLLAMFTIKGRKYNIEYEGLHMLCTTCGRFGHYKEGCPNKVKATEGITEVRAGNDHRDDTGNGTEGPWRVVQKQKRIRKPNNGRNSSTTTITEDPARINGEPARIKEPTNISGSRFASLLEDIPEMDMENLDREDIINNRETEKENFMEGSLHMQNNYSTKGKNKRGNGRGCIKRIEGAERTPKETKLATRGTGAFKAKTGSQVKKGMEQLIDKMGVQRIKDIVGPTSQAIYVTDQINEEETIKNKSQMGSESCDQSGPTLVLHPNIPRPPNWHDTPP
jgi:hypothetical protein